MNYSASNLKSGFFKDLYYFVVLRLLLCYRWQKLELPDCKFHRKKENTYWVISL